MAKNYKSQNNGKRPFEHDINKSVEGELSGYYSNVSIPNPDKRTKDEVMTNPEYRIPQGAVITQSIFDDAATQDLIYNNLLLKPKMPYATQDFNNPFDAYAANGFEASLGRDFAESQRKDYTGKVGWQIDQTIAKEREEKIAQYKRIRDLTKLDYFDGQTEDRINERVKALTEDDPSSTIQVANINNSFTAIPRLLGVLGNFVTPPSKVSLADMYEATLDSTLGSIMQVAKSMIISALGEYTHPNEEIQDLIRYTFNTRLKGNYFHYRALDFLIAGFAVGEMPWTTTDSGYCIPDKCVWAPYTNIEFMIDDFGEMQAALQPNLVASQYGVFGGQDLETPESLFAIRELIPSVLPYIMVEKERLFYIGYDNTFNPYGNSPIRRAYKYYMMKNLALEMFMTALSRNGVPTLAVYYKKDMIKDTNQLQMFKDSIDSLVVGGTIYLPGEKGEAYDVDAIRLDSSGLKVFMDFIDYCDIMMTRSMGFPQEILLGNGSSYSAGTIQKETYEDMLSLYTGSLKDCYMQQIIRPILNYNFTAEELQNNYGNFVPKLRESDKLDKMKQFQVGTATGLINPTSLEDVNAYRRYLGLREYKSESELYANTEQFKMMGTTPNQERGVNTRDTGKHFSHQDGKNDTQ